MKLFGKLFSRAKPAPTPAPEVVLPPPPEAKRITTENVRDWCARLDREAKLTGNQRLAAQAKNIRDRLGVT